MATLTKDKRTVDFDFGGQLDNWQIETILTMNNNNDDNIREYLANGKRDVWSKDMIEEFISFKNSELLDEMIF